MAKNVTEALIKGGEGGGGQPLESITAEISQSLSKAKKIKVDLTPRGRHPRVQTSGGKFFLKWKADTK